MPQNYKVLRKGFGEYPAGAVLPEVALLGNRVESLVAMGWVEPTTAPTTHAPDAPRVRTESTPPPDAYEEMSRLRKECDRLAADNKVAVAHREEAERKHRAVKDEVAKYIAENDQLRRASEEHQDAVERLEKKVAELTAELEAATAPGRA